MQSNFLDWLKKFGPAQNILGPVKGQGIRNEGSSSLFFHYFPSHKFPPTRLLENSLLLYREPAI